MADGNIFAGNAQYFQNLAANRSQQAYAQQLQKQQNLKDAIELFKATRTAQAKPIYDEKRGVLVDPNTGKMTSIAGLPALPNKAGASGKLNPDYARAMAENGISDISQVTPPMLFRAHQANMKDQSNLIEGRTPPQIVIRPGYDALGRPIGEPYRVPRHGGNATPVFAEGPGGPAPMTMQKAPTGMEARTIATVQGILPQLQDLKANMEAIGPEEWNRNVLTRNLDYQRAKHFNILPADPKIAAITSQLIQVEASAQAALLASAGTRSMGFIQNSKGHIPTAYGDYNSIMQNINTLTAPNGPYSSLLKSYELGGGGALSAGGGAKPAASSGQFIGYSPDGRKVYKRANGSMYVK